MAGAGDGGDGLAGQVVPPDRGGAGPEALRRRLSGVDSGCRPCFPLQGHPHLLQPCQGEELRLLFLGISFWLAQFVLVVAGNTVLLVLIFVLSLVAAFSPLGRPVVLFLPIFLGFCISAYVFKCSVRDHFYP